MHPSSFYTSPPSTSHKFQIIILTIIQIKNQKSRKLRTLSRITLSSSSMKSEPKIQHPNRPNCKWALGYLLKSTKIVPFLSKNHSSGIWVLLFLPKDLTLYRRKKRGAWNKRKRGAWNKRQLHYFKLSTRQCRPKIDKKIKERKRMRERKQKGVLLFFLSNQQSKEFEQNKVHTNNEDWFLAFSKFLVFLFLFFLVFSNPKTQCHMSFWCDLVNKTTWSAVLKMCSYWSAKGGGWKIWLD